ncbi:indolepyruvate ferredoxin oxidoreductase subunit alpha [Phosphitispora sp. TUW77]|uniref:indolepyruvate ferredoxin oxidoreductase subunit alpha n=1 Tax=Phosphitispora sp. TUW77 TaxID=3152361 RepID=UPI003AB7DA1D
MKELLTGNEAIARGAYEFGVKVAAAYPGTPSTEILENLVKYPGVYAQWSPNEKVALEVGAGAAIGGARTLVTMKHVGVNVAADPLFTLAYTGVNAGLVLVSADDPGMHSSQNEQDNRNYAKFAKIPVLEPSDSQEAKDMVGLGLQISEQFDTPVMLRTTTRVNHSQSFVKIEERSDEDAKPYVKNPQKYVMVPAHARVRHVLVEERRGKLTEYAESCPANRIEWADRKMGIITSGIIYEYVKEVLPRVSILKIGMTFPLPEKLVREFAAQIDELYVIEELEPFMEDQVRLMGVAVTGKQLFPRIGEVTQRIIAEKILSVTDHRELVNESLLTPGVPEEKDVQVPVRPPVMCPGCPHRGLFYTLSQLKMTVMGDIGCYTLGSLPPLEAMDTCICMGASVGSAMGMEKAHPEMHGKVVAVIGDSTFIHSGITSLLDVVYNKGATTTVILDNSTTAMTGHQDHPATGKTLSKEMTNQVDLAGLVKALGINRVQVVDAFDIKNLNNSISEEAAADEPSVIIVKHPCALLIKEKTVPYTIDENCINCRRCMKLGCPALSAKGDAVVVNNALCTGCGLCSQLCPSDALKKVGEGNG